MSKYKEIAEEIRKEIFSGKYTPNEQLPPEKDMCESYNVSRITIKKAVDQLVEEGLVIKRRGAGTFIKAFVDNSEAEGFSMAKQFCGFSEANKDKKVTSKIFKFEVIHPTAEIATKLKMSTDDFVYYIVRGRYADKEALALEYTYMPISVITGIKKDILYGSIYSYIENELHLTIKSAHKTVKAVKSEKLEVEFFGVDINEPMLQTEQVCFLDDGQPFEYSIAVNRGDNTEFKSVSFK